MGELDVIRQIEDLLPRPGGRGGGGEVGIGDDTAVVAGGRGGSLLLTTDAVVEGVHFDLRFASLADVGWKAVMAAVSDIAAMGGEPRAVLVTVLAPPDRGISELYEGLVEAAENCACQVVGGDLAASPVLAVSISVTGSCGGRKPVLRSGAQTGDLLFCTAPLGRSAAGLRLLQSGRGEPGIGADVVQAHLRPVARVQEGVAAARAGSTAMIDISDGLATDLRHIAAASGVGVRLDQVPVAGGAELEDALTGGEDYELLFTAPDVTRVAASFDDAGLAAPIELGVCTEDRLEVTLDGRPLPAGGYEHPISW